MSLASTHSRLTAISRELATRWMETRVSWSDAKAEEFERLYLKALFGNVDKAVTALEQLDQLIKKVRKDCEKPAGVEQTLQLLEQIRSALGDFAQLEERLKGAQTRRSDTEKIRQESAANVEERRLADELAQAEERFTTSQSRAEARHRTRLSRIRDAHRNVRKAALVNVESEAGKRKFHLQREMLRATRVRDAGLTAADEALATFRQALSEKHAVLVALEGQALDSLGVYGGRFRRRLETAHESMKVDVEKAQDRLIEEFRQALEEVSREIEIHRRRLLPRLSRLWVAWLLLLLSPVPMIPILQYFGMNQFTYSHAIASMMAIGAAGFAVHFLGGLTSKAAAERISHGLGRARIYYQAALERSAATHRHEREQLENHYHALTQNAAGAWQDAVDGAASKSESLPIQIDQKSATIAERSGQILGATLERRKRDHQIELERVKRDSQGRQQELLRAAESTLASVKHAREEDLQKLERSWNLQIKPLLEAADTLAASDEAQAPDWNTGGWEDWTPPRMPHRGVRFGRLEVEVARLAAATSSPDSRVALGRHARLSLPMVLTYPNEGSLLLETHGAGREGAIATLNQIALRILRQSPPGRVVFTIFDPVGLGQNFASLTHLADEADHLISGRIWTQSAQIEEHLGDLNDHLEKVIQMYLRNEYSTIAEYNEQAGNVAEKYHFLVIADFPAGFSDAALRRLASIRLSGARCGVHTLIHWDQEQAQGSDLSGLDLRRDSTIVSAKGAALVVNGRSLPGVGVSLEPPPSPVDATAFIQRVARFNIDSNRVEVPFVQVAPPESQLWSLDATSDVRVPIGRTGATKLQYLAIGKGTRQHALIAGKTGSGKSTLFHVLITNLALWYSPGQVEFYLVDFKKGVEFKCYATRRLPHARVVAIESDREFGLSVLQRVDDELKRRGDLFRAIGAQDLTAYRKAGGSGSVPRVLLMIDEFQELFVEEDRIAQGASVLLDRIVRQGRAFGIHAILGSQTLGGAYTVARTTLGQMVIRIALQCNEADAFLIMDENNSAPRLLSRPGEGIYNDAAGAKEGNSPFQAVWLPDGVRDQYLRLIREKAERESTSYSDPIVFEGDTPADIQENALLNRWLAASPIAPATSSRIWLGAPNSIKGPTEVIFERRSGDNLLIVGQRDDAIETMAAAALVALSAQYPKGTVRFIIFDGEPPHSPTRRSLSELVPLIPHSVRLARAGEIEREMNQLFEEFKTASNSDGESANTVTFLFILGLQDFKKLRADDEFAIHLGESAPSPSGQLRELLTEGPPHGFHVIAACDTYGNAIRFLGRKLLSEFSLRVLFQMSANDSASLIDSPNASRLGLHRALLYQEREGYLELFRPYTRPEPAWIESAARRLGRLVSHDGPRPQGSE